MLLPFGVNTFLPIRKPPCLLDAITSQMALFVSSQFRNVHCILLFVACADTLHPRPFGWVYYRHFIKVLLRLKCGKRQVIDGFCWMPGWVTRYQNKKKSAQEDHFPRLPQILFHKTPPLNGKCLCPIFSNRTR